MILATTSTPVSEQAYRELATSDDKTTWELWDGMLVAKPPMGVKHNDLASYLGFCSEISSIGARFGSTATVAELVARRA